MVSVSNSNPGVLGVPHPAPARIPPLNLVPRASLGEREKSPGDGVGHYNSCPLLDAGVCKYPKGLFPASRRFFYHVVMCSYWIVLCYFFFPQLYWVLLNPPTPPPEKKDKKRKEKKKQKPKRGRCNGTNVPCEASPLD